jgi:hypothetical protein
VKTSSKLTAAFLTTLVVGGSSAGSLFSSVLNEGSSSSLGTAGAFFSTLNLPETSVSVALVPAPKSDETDVVVANANPNPAPSLVSADPATEIRALTQNPEPIVLPEVSPTPVVSVSPEPSLAPQPEPSVTPEPEVSPTSIPTPEPTEALSIEEPSSIEP